MTTTAHPLDGRCLGCHEPLAEDRRDLRYCGKSCRPVVRAIERAKELETIAKASGLREDHEAADAKFAAAWELGEKIRESRRAAR